VLDTERIRIEVSSLEVIPQIKEAIPF